MAQQRGVVCAGEGVRRVRVCGVRVGEGVRVGGEHSWLGEGRGERTAAEQLRLGHPLLHSEAV